MAESKFVNVVSKTTKQKQQIPRKWLHHPTLGRDFELAPSARAAGGTVRVSEPGTPTGQPQLSSDQTPLPVDENSTSDELLQYAAENDIDLDDAQDEAQALAAIRKHHESTSSVEEE